MGAVRKASSRLREKVSVTLEGDLVREVRATTDNVSSFVNEAVRDRLYFARLDAEIARLDAEGVRADPKAVGWWRNRIQGTKRRTEARRAARKNRS